MEKGVQFLAHRREVLVEGGGDRFGFGFQMNAKIVLEKPHKFAALAGADAVRVRREDLGPLELLKLLKSILATGVDIA